MCIAGSELLNTPANFLFVVAIRELIDQIVGSFQGAVLILENTCNRRTENQISRKSIFKKKQLPCFFHNEIFEIQNLFQFGGIQ